MTEGLVPGRLRLKSTPASPARLQSPFQLIIVAGMRKRMIVSFSPWPASAWFDLSSDSAASRHARRRRGLPRPGLACLGLAWRPGIRGLVDTLDLPTPGLLAPPGSLICYPALNHVGEPLTALGRGRCE